MTIKNDHHKKKKEKLRNFENWPQWADLTQVMLEKKEFWNLVNRP